MRAALAVRSELVAESTLQKAANRSVGLRHVVTLLLSDPRISFQGSVNPDQLYKIVVFQGDFLDAKSVNDCNDASCFLIVPSGPQLCLGFSWDSAPSYLAWFAHTSHPSSSSPSLGPLPSIFSAYVSIFILVDVNPIIHHQSIGALYPFANYEILKSIFIAASSYCAIALLCCFIIFPETVNHAYLGTMSTILAKVRAMLASQNDLLSPEPGDFAPGCPKLEALIGMRTGVMAMYQSREYPSHVLLKLPFIL
jgi:hypothetical protein